MVWKKGMELTDLIYSYTTTLPKEERYNLIDQMNRCSCSIPSNIAEGSGKRTQLHFSEFLSTALSSAFELETQLLICQRRNYGNLENLQLALRLVEEIQKMIYSFRNKVLEPQSS